MQITFQRASEFCIVAVFVRVGKARGANAATEFLQKPKYVWIWIAKGFYR